MTFIIVPARTDCVRKEKYRQYLKARGFNSNTIKSACFMFVASFTTCYISHNQHRWEGKHSTVHTNLCVIVGTNVKWFVSCLFVCLFVCLFFLLFLNNHFKNFVC
jgi:hypothetical protein